MRAFTTMIAAAVLAVSGLAGGAAAATRHGIGYTGPSFDCATAKKRVETMICASRSLSAKDGELAAVYSSFIEQYREGGGEGTDISPFEEEQRAWLARRDRCRTCLNQLYDQRISDVTVDY
jgi:uncharacterized protein